MKIILYFLQFVNIKNIKILVQLLENIFLIFKKYMKDSCFLSLISSKNYITHRKFDNNQQDVFKNSMLKGTFTYSNYFFKLIFQAENISQQKLLDLKMFEHICISDIFLSISEMHLIAFLTKKNFN